MRQSTRLQHAATAIAVTTLLAACGGGGGGGDTAGDAETVVLMAAAAGDTGVAPAHLARLNEVRTAMGLAALKWNGALAASAQNHASYLSANLANGHEEEPGLPGFTGASIADRALAAGYGGKLVQETKAGGVTLNAWQARERMDALLQAPLHRMQLLAPEFESAGVGIGAGGSPVVTDMGAVGTPRTTQRRFLYPYNGQAGIATTFMPGSEAGLPENLPAVTGTPLTLAGFLFSMVTYSSASLVEEASGAEVQLIAQSKPGEIKATLMFFPAKPLKPLTHYVWRVTATVDRINSASVIKFVTAADPAPAPVTALAATAQ